MSVCVHPATTISSGWGYDTESHALKKRLEDAFDGKISVREIKNYGITGKDHSEAEFMHYMLYGLDLSFETVFPVGSPLSIESDKYANAQMLAHRT